MGGRTRDLGVPVGGLPAGRYDAITDVPGVLVGHETLLRGDSVRTGVTVVVPGPGSVFHHKFPAAVAVLNAFGKATGVTQIGELGTIETPVALTNSLAVGSAYEGLVRHALAGHDDIGVTTSTVNPVVFECNDGSLNDIRARTVTPDHVLAALSAAASGPVAEGPVGAGTGMVCYGWRGGIGTASRIAHGYTVGALLLTNFGRAAELRVAGVPVGAAVRPPGDPVERGAGSCIVVLATDAPLDARQLGRLARRAGVGLARTGSVMQHGSGEYALAFGTAERVPHRPGGPSRATTVLAEDGPVLDGLFTAVAEAVEESVLNALFAGTTTTGVRGNVVAALPVAAVVERVRAAYRALGD
ncbi:DmpA family aminopeptidase [Actinocatenispora rupis]|uniref:D-aminopeptidase n=1 Tax=Actinocatenispora rupis TaxID=519421 RepID=A0A8J3JAT0_9ACTN|nr:P1 family peptidase [Actinocatenispora rupis]GID15002.1 D-aminopeptidase [Actinocatenispora rupis]